MNFTLPIAPKLRLLLVAMLCANTASSMYWLFLPLYLESLGASVQEIGFFFTFQVILAITFRILGGWLSDGWGRLVTIALGGLFGFAATSILAIAPSWEWTLIAASLSELGASLVEPSFQAYIAEKTPESMMGRIYGVSNALFLVSMILGPVMGALLIEQYDFTTTLYVATGIFSIAAGLRLWTAWGENWRLKMLPVRGLVVDIRKLAVMIFTGRLLLWLFLIDGFVDGSTQLVLPFFPKYTTEIGGISEGQYALLFVWMSLVGMVAMIPGGMFADRFGERRGIALGCSLYLAVWLIMVWQHTLIAFVVAFGLAGMAQAFVTPAISALVSKSVPKAALGMMWGVFATSLGLLAIPAPYLGGVLYHRLSAETPFGLAAILMIIVIPLALVKLSVPVTQTEASVS